MCSAYDLGSYAQWQDRNQVRGQNRVSAITQNLLNLTKLYRKIEHIEQVCRAQWLVPTSKVEVRVMSEGKLSLKLCCSQTTEANLMELHIKIKHNEKVCCAHDLGSYAQGQGRSQVRGQNRVSIITNKTTEANLT